MTHAPLDRQLREVLPEIAYSRLVLWCRNKRLELRLEQVLTAGFTKAKVAVVVVRSRDDERRLVMKYLPPDKRTSVDLGTLKDAVEGAPQSFRDHLVPPWEDGLVTVADDSIIMFMEYASINGQSLVPLQDLLEDNRLGKACARVVKSLVEDWNGPAHRDSREVPADTLLTDLARRTCSPRGKLYEWLKLNWRELLGRSCSQLPDGAGLPNPVHLVRYGGALADRLMTVFQGHSHGDLHSENILMSTGDNGPRPRHFRLIDLSTYRPDGYVAYDPAYLLCSILARRIGALPDDSGPLIDMLLDRKGTDRATFPPNLSDAARRIARTCRQAMCVNGWTEAHWEPNFLLALTAAALTFAGRDFQPPWFLSFAARTAQAALNLLPSPQGYARRRPRPSWSRLITDPPAGVLVLAGPEGIGKTYAVRRTLSALGESSDVDLVVKPIDIHLGSAFGAADFITALQHALGGTPETVTGSGRIRPTDLLLGRLNPLLDRLAGRRVVMAIDSADHLLDRSRKMRDADLGDVLQLLADRQNNTVSVVLVGRETPEPARNAWIDEFAIESFESGLTIAQLKKFLAELDRQDVHRLSDVDDGTWEQFHRRIGGNARAAELAFAVMSFASTESATVAEVAGRLDGVPQNQVIDVLFDAVLHGLDERLRKLLRALAVYRIPVDADAVHAVVGEGSTIAAVHKTLLELAGRNVIRTADSHRFYLHPPDDKRVLRESGFAAVRREFGLRACVHLAGRLTSPIRRLPDLWADRARIDILLDCEEFGEATTLMHEIERRYLWPWGYGWLLIEQRERLRNHVKGIPAISNLNWLGDEYSAVGRFDMAQKRYAEALALAAGPRQLPRRKRILNNLAGVHFQLGDTDVAIARYRDALSIAQEHGRAREEIAPLEGLADCARRRGDFPDANKYLERALHLAGGPEQKTAQVHGLLLKLARRNVECAEYEAAEARLRQIAGVGADPDHPATACHLYDIDADRLLALNRRDLALSYARHAAQLAADVGDPRIFVQARTTMAAIYVAEDNFREARYHIDVAARRRSTGHSLVVLGIRALVLRRLEDAGSVDVFAGLRSEAVARRQDDGADFGAWDFEGLAICGLYLSGRAELSDALIAFGHARDICQPAGLVNRLGDLLTALDAGTGRLTPAIAAAQRRAGE